VVASLPYWWRLCAQALAIFRETPPDLVLTVDFPGLNLRLARWAKRRGIRVVHLVAPQTWAWAPWRTGRLRRAIDRLLVTFPFEQAVFEDAGIATAYVGHPLFEMPLPPPRSDESARAKAPRIELRPGSRRRDVRRQAPIVLDAAEVLAGHFPGAELVARIASSKAAAAFADAQRGRRPIPGLRVEGALWDGAVDAALTTSGTSTAELAAALVPMVVFYRVSWLGRVGKAALVTSPYIAMANLLAGKEAVPERLVGRGGGAQLAEMLATLLSDPSRWKSVRADLEGVRGRLARPGVAARAAREILAP
jgi:lipid-A-disaccharide synthase